MAVKTKEGKLIGVFHDSSFMGYEVAMMKYYWGELTRNLQELCNAAGSYVNPKKTYR